MEYKNEEHLIFEAGGQFNQAIARKLGHPPKDADEVRRALKKEIQEMIKSHNLVVFEGIYGWAYANVSGYGTANTLVWDMLATEEKK